MNLFSMIRLHLLHFNYNHLLSQQPPQHIQELLIYYIFPYCYPNKLYDQLYHIGMQVSKISNIDYQLDHKIYLTIKFLILFSLYNQLYIKGNQYNSNHQEMLILSLNQIFHIYHNNLLILQLKITHNLILLFHNILNLH